MAASPTENPADRFVRQAEIWITRSSSKLGLETPSLDVDGARSVRMEPFVFIPRRQKAAAIVIAHLGKLADLLGVTITVTNVPRPQIALYAGLGYTRANDSMERRPQLRETLTPVAQLRRWWGNTITGEMLSVPNGTDNEDYLFKHQDQFDIFPPYERDALDEMLEEAYRDGWQSVLYDGSNHTLMLRYAPKHSKHYAIQRIAQTVTDQYPVRAIFVDAMDTPDDGKNKFELEGDRLDRFMKSGRLPRS